MCARAQVNQLLSQIQGRFETMSDTIVSRIDAMTERVEGLERSITELMATTTPAAGQPAAPPAAPPHPQ